MHPAVARNLLGNIPRLEGIARIVGQQLGPLATDNSSSDSIEIGASLLRVAIAFDQLKAQGFSNLEAIAELPPGQFDPKIVGALATLQHPPMQAREVSVTHLEPGMVAAQEVRSSQGELLVAKGQGVTYPMVVRLKNLLRRDAIPETLEVLVADSEAEGQTRASAAT